MRNRWGNKSFVKLFLVFFIVILCVYYALLMITSSAERKKAQAQKEQVIAESIETALEYLNGVPRDEVALSVSLRNTTWMTKLAAQTDVFDRQLTFNRMREIAGDFLFIMPSDSEILFRAVYYPYRDMIIRENGWNSAAYYFTTQGVPREEADSFVALINSITDPTHVQYLDKDGNNCFENRVLLVSPVRNSANPSAYLCSMISTAKMREHLSRLLPQYFTGFELTNTRSGIPVLSFQESTYSRQDRMTEDYSIGSMPWTVRFTINEGLILSSAGDQTRWLTLVFAGLVGGCVLAFIFAAYTYQPVYNLLRRLPGTVQSKNAYADIASSIDSMTYKLNKARKEESLRRLLAGFFDKEEDIKLPFSDDMLVQVFMVPIQENGGDWQEIFSRLEALRRDVEDARVEMILSMDAVVVIAGAEQESALVRLGQRLAEVLRAQGLEWISGNVCRGLIGISISYQNVLEKQQYLGTVAPPSYHFPMDWENQLMTAMRSGKSAVTEEIFRVVLKENEKVDRGNIMPLIALLGSDERRIAHELNLSLDILAPLEELNRCERTQEYFEVLRRAAGNICAAVRARMEDSGNIGKKITAYVDANYSDDSFSIVMLEEMFNLSANTINKNIKAATGMSFMPYLISVRMEKAKELLNDQRYKISEIAKMVGYDNEYSFRRAFSKYTGNKVQNYFSGDTNLMDYPEEKTRNERSDVEEAGRR